ncbi:peptidase [Streptomyces celluloflavus]|uniref:peptidase n=1 Tax=Streptomyces celluloflavus TaxID=58344 RepID=UPI00369DBFDE
MRRIALTAVCAATTTVVVLGQTAANAAPAGSAPAHSAPAATVATATNQASAAKLDAYWTPQRIKNAKPLVLPKPKAVEATERPDVKPGKPRLVPAAAPKGGPDLRAKAEANTKAAAGTSVWSTVGRLVFSIPGKGDYLCTANVVNSNNHDVLATARHCVMDIDTGQTYTNFRFAPTYDRGNAPHGWWNWRSMGWRVDDKSAGGDNAFIVLSTGGNDGRHVQDVVGGTGIGFNWDSHNYAHALGIPGDKDYAVWCEGAPYDAQQGGVSLKVCNGLSGGASGGPFVVNYQPDGSAVQTASYMGSWGDAYWAYYRDAAWQVYNGAQNA